MITNGSFYVARNKIENMKEQYDKYAFEIDFLEKYINEKEYFKKIKNTELGNTIYKFLNNGKNQMNFEDYDSALNYFTAGIYFTNCPLFYYLTGKLLLNTYDKDVGVEYLEKYLELGGASKAYNTYGLLGNYYKGLNKEKESYNYDKFYKLSDIIGINKNINDKEIVEKEKMLIEELTKNKNYQSLIELFEESSSEMKLKILTNLYLIGYVNQADKLLKQNIKILESSIDKKSLFEFKKNLTLYRNKGKYTE